ncbi:rhodanese-like domain-containing protein [Floridanema aerugineum]|jgi:rhodanese-related sulfurtransferase|uniref:Rhodanese-like domain-containing protein n=1 Tax=Floridaenema aerugineum BLCC-F46 TaxID=3153654 RepID=A0ABV4X882_9CYAN
MENNLENNLENMSDKMHDAQETVKEKLSDDIKYSGDKVSEAILNAKEKMPNIIPTPPGIKAQSSAHDLKSRLEWGEPALTILDVRDRETFNNGHIMGAMPMPMEQLSQGIEPSPSLALNRDIYIYSDSDEQTSQAASQFRNSGFVNVSELQGGLAAWKAIGGPTEGVVESMTPPTAGDYNVVSRISESAKSAKQ